MTESLDDFPACFARADPMPWDDQPESVLWQWGLDRGKPLTEIASRELIRKRQWLVEKNGSGDYFGKLIWAIDTVLTERQGE